MADFLHISGALSAYISTGITGFPVVVLDTSGAYHHHIALGATAAEELGWFLIHHAPEWGEFLGDDGAEYLAREEAP